MTVMTDTSDLQKNYITVTEAAAIGGVSERTLWRYISCGEPGVPRPVRIAGRVLFERFAVERWAKGRS